MVWWWNQRMNQKIPWDKGKCKYILTQSMGISKNSKRQVHSNANPLQQTRKYLEKEPKLPTKRGFPGGSHGKESVFNEGDLSSIPWLGRLPGGGHGSSLHYSCLENPHRQRSLAGYSPWVHKESDTNEWLSTAHQLKESEKENKI